MTVPATPELLEQRAADLDVWAEELLAPMRCTAPGGANGVHCAACCYGSGYVYTDPSEESLVTAGVLMQTTAAALRNAASAGRSA